MSGNHATLQIEAANAKTSAALELEGIDQSNIISGGRRRRGPAVSASPGKPPKEKKEKKEKKHKHPKSPRKSAHKHPKSPSRHKRAKVISARDGSDSDSEGEAEFEL